MILFSSWKEEWERVEAHLCVGLVLPWQGLEGAALMSRRTILKQRFYSSLVVATGGKKISKLVFQKASNIFTSQSLFKGQIYSSFASPKKSLVLWLNIKAAAWHWWVTIFSRALSRGHLALKHGFDVFFHSSSEWIFSVKKQLSRVSITVPWCKRDCGTWPELWGGWV